MLSEQPPASHAVPLPASHKSVTASLTDSVVVLRMTPLSHTPCTALYSGAVQCMCKVCTWLARSVHDCARSVHGCARSVHGCAPSVHGCVPSVHGCARSVRGCARSVHGCAPSVHGCAPSVHGCARSVHGCVRSVHGCARSVHGCAKLRKVCTRLCARGAARSLQHFRTTPHWSLANERRQPQ